MQYIFNNSLPRSGSELLQVIAHQNPNIYGSPTSPLLEYQFAARANRKLPEVQSQNKDLMQKAFISMCKNMADGYYSAITDRPYVMDKNRGWSHYYEWVNQWNPNPKMVTMVRDLRSVLSSFEKIYRENRDVPEGPDNPAQIENMVLADRVSYWGKNIPLGLALARTLDVYQRRLSEKVLFIRYEDLCNFPQETMHRFYNYIELPYFEHDFQNIKKEVEEDDSHYGIFGNHKIKPKLEPVCHKSWAEMISPELSNRIFNEHRWFFNTFQYDA